MKQEIKNLWLKKFTEDFSLFEKQCYRIVWAVEKIQKAKTGELRG